MALTRSQRGKILAAVIAVLAVGGVAWTQYSTRTVDARARDLRAELVDAYEGTDVSEIPPLFPHEESDLFRRAGREPTVIGRIDDGWRANYRVTALAEARCIWVDWTDSGVDIHDPRRCP